MSKLSMFDWKISNSKFEIPYSLGNSNSNWYLRTEKFGLIFKKIEQFCTKRSFWKCSISTLMIYKISVTRDKIWNIFAATWWRSVTFLIKSDICPSKETKNKIDQFIIFSFRYLMKLLERQPLPVTIKIRKNNSCNYDFINRNC